MGVIAIAFRARYGSANAEYFDMLASKNDVARKGKTSCRMFCMSCVCQFARPLPACKHYNLSRGKTNERIRSVSCTILCACFQTRSEWFNVRNDRQDHSEPSCAKKDLTSGGNQNRRLRHIIDYPLGSSKGVTKEVGYSLAAVAQHSLHEIDRLWQRQSNPCVSTVR